MDRNPSRASDFAHTLARMFSSYEKSESAELPLVGPPEDPLAFYTCRSWRASERRGDRESRSFRSPHPRGDETSCHRMAATGWGASWQPPRYPCHRSPSPRANGLRVASRDRPRSEVVGYSAKSHPRTAGRGTFHRGRLKAWKLPVGHPFTLPRRLSLRMTRRLELGFAKNRSGDCE